MTEWILTSSVLILLVTAVRGLFKERMKAKYVYALWLIVLVRLLCPVNFGALSFNLLSLAEKGQERLERQVQNNRTESTVQSSMTEKTAGNLQGGFTAQTEGTLKETGTMQWENMEQGSPVEPSERMLREGSIVPSEEKGTNPLAFSELDWQKIFLVVWLAGMVLISVVIFNVNLSFGTMLSMFRKELPGFERESRGKNVLPVYVADGIYSSCLFGVTHPSIYLNKKGMDDQEKRYCVEHEYSHYLQGDMVWSLCRTLCLVLHWYNPLVWLAVVLSKKDAELACDERTIERLGEEERYRYGHTLVELAAGQSKAIRVFGMATLMASDKKEVVDRVKAISTKKETKIITGLLVALLVVGMGFFVFTGEARGEQGVEVPSATPVPTAVVTPLPDVTAAATQTPAAEAEQTDAEKEPVRIEDLEYGKDYVFVHTDKQGIYTWELGNEVKDEVTYEELSFTDHVELVAETGKGWKLDLDGNGMEDYLYLDLKRESLYINGFWMKQYTWLSDRENSSVCVLDIDTTDGMYELRIGDDVYYYDGAELQLVADFVCQKWADGSSFVSDICNFERLDEHTVSFVQYSDIYHCKMKSEFYLNEKHHLELVGGYSNHNAEHEHAPGDMRADWTSGSSSVIKNFTPYAEVADRTYTELSFTDHIRLEAGDENGWLVDLNGDGTKEQLCIFMGYICVNGYGMITLADTVDSYIWLLDIDTTDGVYEILLENGTLWVYDGKTLELVWCLVNYSWTDGCTFQGNLYEFTRVDEHTICFDNLHKESIAGGYEILAGQYRLNGMHELVLWQTEECEHGSGHAHGSWN